MSESNAFPTKAALKKLRKKVDTTVGPVTLDTRIVRQLLDYIDALETEIDNAGGQFAYDIVHQAFRDSGIE